MKRMLDNSIDSIVTDPPYELGFMGKKWDSAGIAYNISVWQEALRVLKPGGHLLAFGGTRTYHRMTCAIEDAGFEIRDCIQWIYGSGFPKSLNIGKAVDKIQGNERVIIGRGKPMSSLGVMHDDEWKSDSEYSETKGGTEWEGWGTCLKPANEPIVVARKPLIEKTVAENVLKWRTGGINIDDCRIEHNEPEKTTNRTPRTNDNIFSDESCGFKKETNHIASASPLGRFPSNIILDEWVGELLEEKNKGASRFFYCAKSSKNERGQGNNHPTVKPLKLIIYLINLITAKDGIVLDPFMGSGTTAIACINTNRNYIGFELDTTYYNIATNRITEHTIKETLHKT